MKFIIACLIVLLPQLALADYAAWCKEHPVGVRPRVCADQDPKACVVPLCTGEVAPYDGQLSTPEQAAHSVAELEQAHRALNDCKVSVNYQLDVARISDQALIAAQRQEIEALKTATLAETQLGQPFWQHPAYVWTVTAVAVVGLGITVKIALTN